MASPLGEKFSDLIFRGTPGNQDGVESGRSQKPVADAHNFIIGIRRIGKGFIQRAGALQALFNKRNLVFSETDIFYKRKTLKSLHAKLFFQLLFFSQELVKRV